MAVYLLPWSAKKSKADLIKEDLKDLWKEGRGTSFPELNPFRETLVDHFDVKTTPLAPVWRRYKGSFWEELCMWALPSKVQREIEENSFVVSPVFGLLKGGDLIPYYEVSWTENYNGKNLSSFWKEIIAPKILKDFDSKLIFDFTSSQDRRVITFPQSARVVRFSYIRKGKRVVNPLPHRAYTLRYIVEWGIDLDSLEKINFLDYKVREVKEEGNVVQVIMEGEGRYI